MKYKTDLVSVIMPNKNKADFLEQAISSVIQQDYQEWELIIIDDCSNDKSRSIIQDFAEKDPRIKPIFLEKGYSRSGPVRNEGIKKATGRYIAFLDSDDLWRPEKLSRQKQYMKRHQNTLCTSHTSIIDHSNRTTGEYTPKKQTADWADMLNENYISTSATMIDRKDAPHIEFADYKHCQDYACWMSIIKQSGPALIIPEKLAQYRINPDFYVFRKLPHIYYRWHVHRKDLQRNALQTALDFVYYAYTGMKKAHKYVKNKPKTP